MKTNSRIIITLGMAATLAFIVGCDGQTSTQSDTKADTAATASAAASAATAKANAIIDQARTLIGQTKYTEALNTLQPLSSFKLTAEQEKIVSGLKEQIQKAMAAKAATDGTKAVGDLLPK